MRKMIVLALGVCLIGGALGYGLLRPRTPVPAKAPEPMFIPWTAVVDSFFGGNWGEDAESIPSTVIDTGVLKNVPYCSWRAGDFELNIYGDMESPACMECGVYGQAAHDPAAQAKVREFVAAALTQAGARELASRLKAEGETGVAGGFTIETTPPEAPDAYGGWWVSVYSEKYLAAARATDKEMKDLTVTIDPSDETGLAAETQPGGVAALPENGATPNAAPATMASPAALQTSVVVPTGAVGTFSNGTPQGGLPPVGGTGASYPTGAMSQTVMVTPSAMPMVRPVSLANSGWSSRQFSMARPSTTIVVVNASPPWPQTPYPSSVPPSPVIRNSSTPPPIPASPAPAIRNSSTPPPIPTASPPAPAIRASSTPPPIPSSATPASGIHISSTPANHTVDSSTPLHVTPPSARSTPAAARSGPSISVDSSHASSLTVHSGSSASKTSAPKTVYVQSYSKSSGTYKPSSHMSSGAKK